MDFEYFRMRNSLVMIKKNCSAIILAAGNSSRMGSPKFLLKMPDGTSFLESLTHQYAGFGCSEIVVVMSNEGFALLKDKPQNLPSQTQITINTHVEFGRFYSIKTGMKQLSTESVFIHNIDNPYANKNVLEQIYKAKSESEVIKPIMNGKGGHPVLLSKRVCELILNEKNNDQNFKVFLNSFRTKKVKVEDETVLLNMNTYDEYLEFYSRKVKK